MTAGGIGAMTLFYFVPYFSITPKTNLLLDIFIAGFLLWAWRIWLVRIAVKGHKINVCFWGETEETKKFVSFLGKTPSLGYRVIQTLDNADLVVVEPNILQNEELVKMFYDLLPFGITIEKFSEFYEAIMARVPTSIINKTWFLENLAELSKRPFEITKRVADFVFAIILFIPFFAIFPFVALIIKLDSNGTVFYKQKRVGKNGKVFEFIKFRSMVKNADTINGFKGNGSDSRHTRVGKILRKTYIDELPQIINVIRGEMSFIGPRPERPHYVEELKEKIPFYEIRLLVRPGITGWAQINMENDASVEDAPEKLQYDLYYIKNRSITMDLAVALKTASIMVSRNGR